MSGTDSAIRLMRAVRGMSQTTLAHASGLPSWRIWKIENGYTPTATELAAIWGALSSDPPRRRGIEAPTDAPVGSIGG
jgi:hypothetical protein